MTKQTLHKPVLLASTLAKISPEEGEMYLDLTAGMGGHSRAILNLTKNYKQSVLVDRDAFAISQLQDLKEKSVKLMNQDFLSAVKELEASGSKFDLILLDLGVSSPQLDHAERGFSFTKMADLDMRMDRSSELNAYQVVNKYNLSQLSQIFVEYGEVKKKTADKVSREIVLNRPILTTVDLANVISRVVRRRGKIHPATVYFQAIRIEVNDELNQLKQTLEILPKILEPGGRLAIISFHSLEDRIVKQYFKNQFGLGLLAELKPLTKKPILGSIEDAPNPRSRSAILRVVIKTKTNKRRLNAKTNSSLE